MDYAMFSITGITFVLAVCAFVLLLRVLTCPHCGGFRQNSAYAPLAAWVFHMVVLYGVVTADRILNDYVGPSAHYTIWTGALQIQALLSVIWVVAIRYLVLKD